MEMSIINQPRVFPRQRIYLTIKRMVDIAICIFGLPIALPIMIACALAITLEDCRGSIFFTQERIGKGGRPFKMFKFRTMRTDIDTQQCRRYMKAYIRGELGNGEESEQPFKPIPQQKILRVGRILRRTSLDELPQIFNVLRGDMSIIGPRPNVLWEVEEYRSWHYERLEVLPGMTGLAQVRGRSCINFNALVRFDIAYIEKQGFVMDLQILWWTLKTIISSHGAS